MCTMYNMHVTLCRRHAYLIDRMANKMYAENILRTKLQFGSHKMPFVNEIHSPKVIFSECNNYEHVLHVPSLTTIKLSYF